MKLAIATPPPQHHFSIPLWLGKLLGTRQHSEQIMRVLHGWCSCIMCTLESFFQHGLVPILGSQYERGLECHFLCPECTGSGSNYEGCLSGRGLRLTKNRATVPQPIAVNRACKSVRMSIFSAMVCPSFSSPSPQC